MGPLYSSKWFQDIIQVNSSSIVSSGKIESIFFTVTLRRDQDSSPEMGIGKGTRSGNSRLLFPTIPCTRKEWKVTSSNRSFFTEPMYKETTLQDGVSQVSKTIDCEQRLGCLHRLDRCLSSRSDHPQSRKYLRCIYEDQIFQFTALPFGMSLNPWIFTKLMDIAPTSTCHISFSLPRRLADKKSDLQSITMSDKILPSNSSRSRFHSIGINISSEFHVHRHGISDTAKLSQGPSRLSRGPNFDYQISSFLQSSIGTNFPFSFGQTQCSSRLCSPWQTSLITPFVLGSMSVGLNILIRHSFMDLWVWITALVPWPQLLTTSANVSLVCLEISHSSSWSSDYDQQYDSISFELVDGHQSLCTRNCYPSSSSQCIPIYGCQSLWLGSSFKAYPFVVAGRKTNPSSISIF